jgi:hypothetical protein
MERGANSPRPQRDILRVMSRRVCFVSVVVVAGCGSAEAPARGERASAPAAAAQPAKATAAAAVAPTPDETPDPDAAVVARPDDLYLLGRVGQDGVLSCADPTQRTWLHVTPTIGTVPVGGVTEAEAATLMGKAVVAIGTRGVAPTRPPLDIVPCPPMQMREDWIDTPQGILMHQGSGPPLPFFEATVVREIEGFVARREGDQIAVDVTNPLPIPMTAVEVTLHYEGCFGKPGSIGETSTVAELEPDATTTLTWEALHTRGDRSFRAYSVQWRAAAPHVVFDLDVPLSALGAVVECPPR